MLTEILIRAGGAPGATVSQAHCDRHVRAAGILNWMAGIWRSVASVFFFLAQNES
jgi:hypothetical protein